LEQGLLRPPGPRLSAAGAGSRDCHHGPPAPMPEARPNPARRASHVADDVNEPDAHRLWESRRLGCRLQLDRGRDRGRTGRGRSRGVVTSAQLPRLPAPLRSPPQTGILLGATLDEAAQLRPSTPRSAARPDKERNVIMGSLHRPTYRAKAGRTLPGGGPRVRSSRSRGGGSTSRRVW
jgi:hypothetical protein